MEEKMGNKENGKKEKRKKKTLEKGIKKKKEKKINYIIIFPSSRVSICHTIYHTLFIYHYLLISYHNQLSDLSSVS